MNIIIENKNNINAQQNIYNGKYNNENKENNALFYFAHILKAPPQSKIYDKAFGLYCDRKEDKHEISKVPATITNDH